MKSKLPIRAIREQMSSAFDLVVQQARLRDGSRKITHLTEVLGMEGDTVTLQDLFVFEAMGMDERNKVKGSFRATGIRPKFLDKLTAAGIHLPNDVFQNNL